MRSFTLLSAWLLLAALPHTLAAPTAQNSISARDSSKVASVAARHAVAVADDDDDPEDDYIVVLDDSETRDWDDVFTDIGCNKTKVHSTFTLGGSRGFTMNMKKSSGVSMFSLPNVRILEKNQKMHLAVMPRDSSAKKMFMSRDMLKSSRRSAMLKRQSGTWIEQSTAPWNLQRVSSESRVDLNGRSATDLSFKYRFEQTAGAGVDVYVLDTGINVDHVDFGGRATMDRDGSVSEDLRDVEGHGTHTAGTIGSRTFGIAKNCRIIGMKVFHNNGTGSLFNSINAIDRAIVLHSKRNTTAGFRGSIISMSLGASEPSPFMTDAIGRAVAAGMHVSVAAGNEGQDACNTTPAGISEIHPMLTVGATDTNDFRASFSNFGNCTNIYAPGTEITSTFIGSNIAIDVLQGTSMACPLVTGLMAVELSLNPQFASDPERLRDHMKSLSLKDVLRGIFPDSPANQVTLANNGFPGDP